MNTAITAYIGADIFDGRVLQREHALLVSGGIVVDVIPAGAVPMEVECVDFGAGTLAPGFVDLQVNGGGGVMFNEAPNIGTLETMAATHGRLGATAILPTLISDSREKTRAAIEAVRAAVEAGVPGIAGLHLEGPHLAATRKGAHAAEFLRPMDNDDLEMLARAAETLPALLLTVAPEVVSPEEIAALTGAGAVVSLGHSDAEYDMCLEAVEAGASAVTHLFNAMSQMTGRAPGLVGAALDCGALSAGLIADMIHVHPASIASALRGKVGPGRIFLVSDAMAVAGIEAERFELNGREILRRDGRLTLADGTLAGADLDLPGAVRNLTGQLGLPAEIALSMASSIPAAVAGLGRRHGWLKPGHPADLVHLDPTGRLASVWRDGAPVY
ncbi:N-acetylglucosamine-6-phosphate deacetylase [Tropicimonas sp. TH_r6]|uniref:N-acetylglucosamine-6-phosphate deacetylase n=1 Tax=Tropicimonas sp. TH_r6 TaxID=3082085 RepID=UPI0029555851|nr:N-acetylglucosamine-6-phosphate deacetylase [Tropicimonas sp. TH_r6]MDV7142300.1 N-acetylglucosamine-6-phosphate deacetylase [Tropicimonas sp. TH_r6]